VDAQVSLVFSWDPRTKVWVKERGPDDASPPPTSPIDPYAVQTYFLDPQNGKWSSTILALKARQISVDLADDYRAPFKTGLTYVPTETAADTSAPRSRVPLAASLAALLFVAGGAIVLGQTVFGPTVPAVAAPPTAAPSAAATVAPTAPDAGANAEASAAAETTAAPAAPVATPRPRTPVPTAVPTPRPPQTLRLNTRLPNGTTVYYSGPASIAQGSVLNGIFSVVLASGQGGNENLTVYLGDPNTPGGYSSALGGQPDANGNYVLWVQGSVPKGEQRLSVIYGTVPGIFTLGTITVR
jgi:hypothetical protein